MYLRRFRNGWTLETPIACAVIPTTGLTELGSIVIGMHLTCILNASLAGNAIKTLLLINGHWGEPFRCTEQFLPKHFGIAATDSN